MRHIRVLNPSTPATGVLFYYTDIHTELPVSVNREYDTISQIHFSFCYNNTHNYSPNYQSITKHRFQKHQQNDDAYGFCCLFCHIVVFW